MRTFVRVKETPQEEGNPRVVTVYGELRERKINGVRTKEFAMGWSICNPEDKYDPAFGGKIAKGRINWKKAITTTNGCYLCPDMCECLMDNEVDYISENWHKFIFPKKNNEYVAPEATKVACEPENDVEPSKDNAVLSDKELSSLAEEVARRLAQKGLGREIEGVSKGKFDVKRNTPNEKEWEWHSDDGNANMSYKFKKNSNFHKPQKGNNVGGTVWDLFRELGLWR